MRFRKNFKGVLERGGEKKKLLRDKKNSSFIILKFFFWGYHYYVKIAFSYWFSWIKFVWMILLLLL